MNLHPRSTALAIITVMGLMLPASVYAQLYIGAEIGQADTELDEGADNPPDYTSSDSDTAWKVFAGYNYSSNFAAELGYGDLGDYDIKDNTNGAQADLNFTAWYATFIGRVQIHDRWKLFGRLGFAYWNTDLDYTEPGFSSSGDDSGIDPVVGLGFEFTPADNLGIRFEWEQFQNVGDGTKTSLGAGAGNLELNGHDVNIIGIGVTYKFHFAH